MRVEQLEAWVLSIVDRVQGGLRVEDARVELKADWPPPVKAARRIAGHANAAGSDVVLWIIGVDESKGVVPMTPVDIAQWRDELNVEFDGIAPDLTDLVVPIGPSAVTALLFDATRRPFVVRNPSFGQAGAGTPVSLEVPWRRGTSIHTARRDELLRLLVPQQQLPILELLEARVVVAPQRALDPMYGGSPSLIQRIPHFAWQFFLTVYVTPPTTDLMALPTHKATLVFRLESGERLEVSEFRFLAPSRDFDHSSRESRTVTASGGEAVFTGPGLVSVQANRYEASRSLPIGGSVLGTLAVGRAGSDSKAEVPFRLVPAPPEEAAIGQSWLLDK